MMSAHADDLFHPPSNEDPFWTETCWFTFAIPERKLSGQLYPFFRPNQGVASGACILWDPSGDQLHDCLFHKNLWHLPIPPDQNLDDIRLANGIHYRCIEPLSKYELHFLDPDREEVEIRLTYQGICEPNRLGEGHLDQPGRYTGTIRIEDDTFEVNAFGMRDRSWGVRSQIGSTLHPGAPYDRGGYTYATASDRDAWHVITAQIQGQCIGIHGFLLRDGVWSKLAEGRREVLERRDHCPSRVRITGRDELGRTLEAEGTPHNRIGVHLNPNLWTWNCLTEWRWDGGCSGWGEDHDNWSASAFRRFVRTGESS
jgi:hypothetical protein